MKDTVYLMLGVEGVESMRKTKPKGGSYVEVTIDVPSPPRVTLTLPEVSPTVTGTLRDEPVAATVVWCDKICSYHYIDDMDPEDTQDPEAFCEPADHHPLYHEKGFQP